MMTLLMTAALFLGEIAPAQPQVAAPASVAAPAQAAQQAAQPVAQVPAAQPQVAVATDDEFDDDFLEGEDTLDEEIALLDGSDDLMEDDEDQ